MLNDNCQLSGSLLYNTISADVTGGTLAVVFFCSYDSLCQYPDVFGSCESRCASCRLAPTNWIKDFSFHLSDFQIFVYNMCGLINCVTDEFCKFQLWFVSCSPSRWQRLVRRSPEKHFFYFPPPGWCFSQQKKDHTTVIYMGRDILPSRNAFFPTRPVTRRDITSLRATSLHPVQQCRLQLRSSVCDSKTNTKIDFQTRMCTQKGRRLFCLFSLLSLLTGQISVGIELSLQ